MSTFVESKMPTKPDVFIIESLSPDDEGNGRFEGPSISHVLKLHEKNPIYRYVRTRKQFQIALDEFHESSYRYLHISCHGGKSGMTTTNLDEISYKDLAVITEDKFNNKRIFLSACSMVHPKMAREIIPKSKSTSIVGPIDDIDFATASVFWPALYHMMLSIDNKAMKRNDLRNCLNDAASLFKLNIAYFSYTPSNKQKFMLNILKK